MPYWRAVTRSIAERVGIDPDIFERQIRQESGFDPNAGSPAGALGIAQIVPKYHPSVDPLDPYAALTYAATWMKQLYGQYGNWRDALIHYNGGGGAIQRWRSGRPIEESVQYINAILGPGKAEAGGLPTPELGEGGTPITSAGGATMASPQLPAPPELQAVERVKGNPVSIRKLDPKVKDEFGMEADNLSPTLRFLFKDGTYLDIKSNYDPAAPGSAQAASYEVIGGTALASAAKADDKKPSSAAQLEPITDPNTGKTVKLRDPVTGTVIDLPDAKAPTGPKRQVVTINGKRYLYDPDTDTTTRSTLPDEVEKPEKPKRSTHTFGGRIYTTDENGNVVNSADVRTAEERQAAGLGIQKTQQDLAEGSIDLEKKKRDLLPKQQQIIQGHYDTIKYVQGMLERDEITPSQADAYVAASNAAAQAGLQGTTPFAMREAEETADRERKKMGVDLVNQRISSGGALASGLMSSAASLGSRAMLRPGQTSLGVDPLAAAMAFMQQTNSVAQADPLTAGLLSGARTPPPMPALPPGAPAGI